MIAIKLILVEGKRKRLEGKEMDGRKMEGGREERRRRRREKSYPSRRQHSGYLGIVQIKMEE